MSRDTERRLAALEGRQAGAPVAWVFDAGAPDEELLPAWAGLPPSMTWGAWRAVSTEEDGSAAQAGGEERSDEP